MGYFIDLEKWNLDGFKADLKAADLLPSQRAVLDDIDFAFAAFSSVGLKNVEALLEAVKTKGRLLNFAQKSGVDEAYLMVLARYLKGYRKRINKLADFPDTPEDAVKALAALGIKTSFDLYERVLTEKKREELAQESGVASDAILRLASLSDLSRIRWVNHTFAYVLYECGYISAQKVAAAAYLDMHQRVISLNKARGLYKGSIGAHDMKMCVESAGELSVDMQFC